MSISGNYNEGVVSFVMNSAEFSSVRAFTFGSLVTCIATIALNVFKSNLPSTLYAASATVGVLSGLAAAGGITLLIGSMVVLKCAAFVFRAG